MRHKILWSLLTVFLLLVLATGWLLATESGLRSVISIVEKAVPELDIEQAEGRLIDTVHLQRLSFKPNNANGVEVADIIFDWQPKALLKATLLVNELAVSDVKLFITESSEEDTASADITLPEVVLPLRVEIAELIVDKVQMVTANNETEMALNQLSSTLTLNYAHLQISHFSLDRDDVALQLTGDIALQSPYQTALQYQLDVKQALAEEVKLAGNIKGDVEKLTIDQQVSAPFKSTQSASISDLLSEFQWSFQLQAESLDLAQIVPEQQIQLNSINLNAEGNLESVTAKLATSVVQADLPPLAVIAAIESKDLAIWTVASEAKISEQSQLKLSGDIDLNDELPSVDLQALWQNLQWPLLGDEAIVKQANGKLLLSGTMSAFTATVATELEVEQQRLSVTAETAGTQSSIEIKQLIVEGFNGQVHADGQLDWQKTPLQYQLNADWQGLKLPAALTGLAVDLKQGRISLDGTPQALKLSTKADILLDEVSMTVDADASGETDKGFEQTRLDIALADGKLQYQGNLLWADGLLMDGVLSLNKMNPGVLAPQWPGELSGKTKLSVKSRPEAGIQIQASQIAIDGSLRQRPLKLNGAIDYSQSLVNIEQLTLQSGDSSLQANGQLQQDKLAFDWVLKSPDLQDFHPDIFGKMNVSGQARGSLQAPEIKADLAGSNLRYQTIKAETVNGKVNIAMSDNASFDTQLNISGLDLPQLPVESLTIGLNGRNQQHDISVDMVSPAMTVAMTATGSLAEQRWQGNLDTFSLENAKAGKWTLQQQDTMVISADTQQIPEHCWASDNGRFCLQAANSQQGWQTLGQFDAVPLSLFEAFTAELEQLQGMLRGNFNLVANKDQAITGKGEVFLDKASLKLDQTGLNQQKPISLNNTLLQYEIDADKTTAIFYLEPDLEGVSAIDASFETVGLSQLLANTEPAPLTGTVTAAIQDLSQLQLSHPAFTDLKGKFDLNLAVSGTTSQPQIEGQAKLAQAQVAIVDAGIVLKQLEANINGTLEQVSFDYQATSGNGTLNGEGSFLLKDNSWELKTALKAAQFTIIDTPEAFVIAEPDLAISMTPELTKVSGKIAIPEASLEPTQFNSTVSPSRDVIVITDQQTQPQGATTQVDIRIILGDKVKLKALGFQGRLTGDLRVSGNTSDILLANGEIKIREGSYLAYGRLLKVDDGSIRYAGGAIDNPELDIKAVRVGTDYKAGLHIEGYASAPQANLFAEPDMSHDNILSYILLGKPVEQASATDAALLASAASGLGLQNGAMISDQIASTFGLDEFAVKGDSAENAALQIGKYLSPKLYLSYGIGVFESVSTVELRYQLSKIWALKAESGTESGVDLLYTYERGGPK